MKQRQLVNTRSSGQRIVNSLPKPGLCERFVKYRVAVAAERMVSTKAVTSEFLALVDPD
jgi:hypothetical protein